MAGTNLVSGLPARKAAKGEAPMIVLIGSHAARHHRCLSDHIPKDLDVIGEYEDIRRFVKAAMGDNLKSFMPTNRGKSIVAKSRDGLIIEAEIAWPGSLAEELMQIVRADANTCIQLRNSGETASILSVPSLNILYMLKMSHRFLKNSPHFEKTLNDAELFKTKGAFIEPEHFDFYKRREAATYDYKHPVLNVAKKDFFTGDGVKYVYDHDSIHEAVKHLHRPAYTYFKPPTSEVMCSREMFELLPFQYQLYAVLEEAYVLAAERSQLSFPHSKIDPKTSFLMALEKVCTSITSGWFREFAWSNYYNVRALYNGNYMDRIYAGVEAGVVIPYDPAKAY